MEAATNLFRMAALTGITKLQLFRIEFPPMGEENPFKKLRLLELALSQCTGLAKVFLVPGSLQSLQKLSVSHSRDLRIWSDAINELGTEACSASLCKLRAAIFGLPNLVEISGRCVSLMPFTEKAWKWCTACKCEYKSDPIKFYYCYCVQTWKKVL